MRSTGRRTSSAATAMSRSGAPSPDSMHVAGGASEQVGKARPVRDESAGRHALLRLEHPRQPVLRKELDDAADVKLVERIVAHQDGIGSLAHYRGEGGVEVANSADFDRNQERARG